MAKRVVPSTTAGDACPAPTAPTAEAAPTITLSVDELTAMLERSAQQAAQQAVERLLATMPQAPTAEVPTALDECMAVILAEAERLPACQCVPNWDGLTCPIHNPAPAPSTASTASTATRTASKAPRTASTTDTRPDTLTDSLAPLAAYDWPSYGPDTRLITPSIWSAIRQYLQTARNRPGVLVTEHAVDSKGRKVTPWAASIAGKVAEGFGPYVQGGPGLMLTMAETRAIAAAAHREALARVEYRKMARAGAASQTVSTNAARKPASYPQNQAAHTPGARQWTDAELAEALAEAHARGGSFGDRHVVPNNAHTLRGRKAS